MTTPIGPELGRLAAPSRSNAPFEAVRLALLDAIIAANAAGQLSHPAWEDAFSHAAHSLRIRVIGHAETALRNAAATSRYPARRLRHLLPDATAGETLLNRLLAEGMPLEQLAGAPGDAAGRRARATALETAWDGAAAIASRERARWDALARDVAAWRRPMAPIWVTSVVVLATVLIAAAWLGGQLPAPAWFRPVNDAWWRLWP